MTMGSSRFWCACLAIACWPSDPARAAQVVANLMIENNRPVIVDGKLAKVDKGSRDGINEGDAIEVHRGGAQGPVVAVGKTAAVFRDCSMVLIPVDRPGTTIQPGDVFVAELADLNQVQIAGQNGHAAKVPALAFSPDDRYLASGDSNGLVAIWSMADRRLLYTFRAGVILSGLEFSNDGNTLITASEDDHNNLKVWDLRTGRIITLLTGHTAKLSAIAAAPSASLLASSSWDDTVKVWDLNSYQERCTCKVHPAESLRYGVAFSPDGERVIAPVIGLELADGVRQSYSALRVWSAQDCREMATIRADQRRGGDPTMHIWSLAGGRTTDVQATGDTVGRIRIWETAANRQVAEWSIGDLVYSVSLSAAGDLVAIGSRDGAVHLWNRTTGRKEQIPSEMGKAVLSVRISRTGKYLAWGSEEPTVSLYDLSSNRKLPPLTGRDASVERLARVNGGQHLAAVSGDGSVRLWNMETGRLQSHLQLPGKKTRVVSVSPSGVVMAHNHPAVQQWPPMTSRVFSGPAPPQPSRVNITQNTFGGTPLCSAEAPGGRFVAFGNLHAQVALFDMQTGTVRQLNEPDGDGLGGSSVEKIAYSADGRYLAWVDMRGNAELWTAQDPRRIATWKHRGVATSIAFSPDGEWVASGGWDSMAIVQSTSSPNAEPLQLGEHWGFIFDLAFSPDDSQLAVAAGGSISIWNLKDRRLERVLDVPAASVESVAFLKPGILASGQRDSTVELWNSQTGSLLATLLGLDGSNWLAFTPDGFFDGTPAAWKNVPFHFRSDLLQLFEPEQFFNEFFQPGLVDDVVRDRRPIRSLLAARGDARSRLDLSVYRASHLPVVRIAQLDPNLALLNNSTTVALSATDTGSGVQDCRIFRNESLVDLEHGVLPRPGKKVSVSLSAGTNVLKSYCFNRDGLKSKDFAISVKGRPILTSPRAYIIAVGVDVYSNTQFNLRFAKGDAADLAATLNDKLRAAGSFTPVPVVISDGSATKANVLAALGRLAGDGRPLPSGAPADLGRIGRAEPDDLVVLFFAGHGMTVGSRYYLVPHDLGYGGPRLGRTSGDLTTIENHSISDQELQSAFEHIAAAQNILIIDACESGQVLEMSDKRLGPMNARGMAQLAYEKGMYVLAAAQSKGAAIEAGGRYGHGLLTFALVEEGLKTTKARVGSGSAGLTERDWLD
jgi:WD40 repeat protein